MGEFRGSLVVRRMVKRLRVECADPGLSPPHGSEAIGSFRGGQQQVGEKPPLDAGARSVTVCAVIAIVVCSVASPPFKQIG